MTRQPDIFTTHLPDFFRENAPSDSFCILRMPLSMATLVSTDTITVDGSDIFYRHAGPNTADAPTILLLMGFPSSSHQFRNLMPLLAAKGYRVIAPDLPGFGFTTAPPSYSYTFANLAETLAAFVDQLQLARFAMYIFDYGAPVGLRLALRHPDRIAAVVTQNGNAYEEGLGGFWEPLRRYWASGADEDREKLRGLLTFEATRWQYLEGSPHPERVAPEAYHLDQALLEREGNKEIQLGLFWDYRENLTLYPRFQEYLRTSGVPVLAIWGRNDEIFVEAGAEAFGRDAERFELRLLDAGHFALETNEVEFAETMDAFFERFGVFE